MPKFVDTSEFKENCLDLIAQMGNGGEAVVVTNGGRPVAMLTPIAASLPAKSIIGAMKGSVSRYDDPFSPALDADAWDALR